MRELTIAGRRIADDEPCFVIAEIGHNHGGSQTQAIELIQRAALCGASAVKFQKRDIGYLYTQALLDQPYEHEHSYGKTYGEHRRVLELGWADYHHLFDAALALNILAFATPFDEPSADVLDALGVPAFKIHSGGLADKALITYVARFDKPVLLSTGGAWWGDITQAVRWLDNVPHAILHCTASYPLIPAEANLRVIETLRHEYPETVIGWSSHAPGIALSLAAYICGARILEHHFTLNRASKGTDHRFSLEPKGLATLVEDLEQLRLGLGDGVKRVYDSEAAPLAKMRRCRMGKTLRIGTLQEQFEAAKREDKYAGQH